MGGQWLYCGILLLLINNCESRMFGIKGSFGGGVATLTEILDYATCTLRDVGRVKLSGSNLLHISAMAVDPTTGTLFAVSNANFGLYTIDKTTAVATKIATWVNTKVPDLAFDRTGQLWGLNRTSGRLSKINKVTGAFTPLASTVPAFWRTGLVFAYGTSIPTTLYMDGLDPAKGFNALYQVNATGSAILLRALADTSSSLEWDPKGQSILFATLFSSRFGKHNLASGVTTLYPVCSPTLSISALAVENVLLPSKTSILTPRFGNGFEITFTVILSDSSGQFSPSGTVLLQSAVDNTLNCTISLSPVSTGVSRGSCLIKFPLTFKGSWKATALYSGDVFFFSSTGTLIFLPPRRKLLFSSSQTRKTVDNFMLEDYVQELFQFGPMNP